MYSTNSASTLLKIKNKIIQIGLKKSVIKMVLLREACFCWPVKMIKTINMVNLIEKVLEVYYEK